METKEKKLSPSEIKKIEFEMLKTVSHFCQENNIWYSLAYGTLLGAVRHKGFIPWDDDIDLIMFRDDYEKFLSIFNAESVLPLEAQTFSNGKGYKPFIKVVNLKTRASRYENGIWIDIFPLDVFDNKTMFIENTIRKMIIAKTTPRLKNKGLKQIFKRVLKFILLPISINHLLKLSNKFVLKNKTKKTQLVGNMVWGAYYKRDVFLKDNIYERTDVVFEGEYFKAIKNYDSYLSQIYGNYLELPPENKRRSHSIEAWIIE
jgi:lipopolysaccharide cholinephosphotransferase